jgi:hypothetical protein
VFTGLTSYNPLAIVVQASDEVSFKTSRMQPDEIFVLVTDLKEIFEAMHKKVEKTSSAERVKSRKKAEKHTKPTLKLETSFWWGRIS